MFTLQKLLGVAVITIAALHPSLASSDTTPGRLLAEGRVDDAISLLQSKISNDSHDAESYNLLCRAHLLVDEWDAGITACEKAISIDPGNPEYHSWLGRIYGEKAGHASFISAAHLAGKVRTEFETAVRLNPKSVDARDDLADFYLEAPGIVGGGKDKAEAQAQEIAKADPAQADRVRAKIAEDKKDFATAENDYRLAIKVSGGQAGTWLNLARFYGRRGRLDEMNDTMKHATDPKMNRADLLMGAAELLINVAHDFSQAAQLLRRYLSSGATVEDAPVFKAHYLLGTILERDGDKQAAADQYQAALSLAKNFSPAREALNRLKHQTKPN